MKAYTNCIHLYHKENRIAQHARSYDRHRDFENPDHPKELLAQRRAARNQKILMRFLTFSPKSQQYYEALEERRMNPQHHTQKIVALSEIYGVDAVARAMEDAFTYQAFSCEYIANLLEQRKRILPEPGALHLTRKQDMLDLEIEKPNIDIYCKSQKGEIS